MASSMYEDDPDQFVTVAFSYSSFGLQTIMVPSSDCRYVQADSETSRRRDLSHVASQGP